MSSGWKNHETFLVFVWLTNDEGLYDYWRDVAARLCGEDITEKECICRFASFLKDYLIDEAAGIFAEPCLYQDFLTSAVNRVDLDAIASSFIEGENDD